MSDYQQSTLWQQAFAPKQDGLDPQRQLIVTAYKAFRERVNLLLQKIKAELPDLTIHDITHVDALWQVASTIAGPEYPLNPAEALVLGGAFLLHDAAHCRAAFAGGLDEVRATPEWQSVAAQRGFDPNALISGSPGFQAILFETLRQLHPRQAKKLPFAKWSDKPGEALYLFPHDELRDAYGDLIGAIAESHWFHPHELEVFSRQLRTAPPYLSPAQWTVNPLKIAILLRVADAAHIDAKRAPRLLLAMNQPAGISRQHWQFQSKLSQVACDAARNELLFSGSPFAADEQEAWWLAYDAANLADRELAAADHLLRDHDLPRLAAREVACTKTPGNFARQVPTNGWHPVDTSLRISNIHSVVERFGGEKLYGKKPYLALRELLQNARDAIHAARSLKYLDEDEGEIEVAVEDVPGGHWLHVTDNGIGMSRYVLTEVLLDFGHSLWRSPDLGGEWGQLAASGFEAIGQFGIGFFSIFMLGDQVRVISRRCETKDGENSQWLLEFPGGIKQRPLLRTPQGGEKRRKPGTRVSVFISAGKLEQLCHSGIARNQHWTLAQTCAYLAPALDIDLYYQESGKAKECVVRANDWKTLEPYKLLQRLDPHLFKDDAPGSFGLWSHLTAIHNSQGVLIGRCATSRYINIGCGVVKGLFAGSVSEMAGIIFSEAQPDLARKNAIPVIRLAELQKWANAQKSSLAGLNKLDESFSSLLAFFGASFDGLIIGKLGGVSVTYEGFIESLKTMDEILLHTDDVSHTIDDDVLERDFDDYYEPLTGLLETSEGAYLLSSWLDELKDQSISRESWSIKIAVQSALAEAWGNVDEHEAEVLVGHVDGTEIYRECIILKRAIE